MNTLLTSLQVHEQTQQAGTRMTHRRTYSIDLDVSKLHGVAKANEAQSTQDVAPRVPPKAEAAARATRVLSQLPCHLNCMT